MNGAALRSGTMREGIAVTTPAIVGALVRKPWRATVEEAATAVVEAFEPAEVAVADDAAVDEPEDVADVLAVTVARFGKSVGVVCCACMVEMRRRLKSIAIRRRLCVKAIMTS